MYQCDAGHKEVLLTMSPDTILYLPKMVDTGAPTDPQRFCLIGPARHGLYQAEGATLERLALDRKTSWEKVLLFYHPK